ncbi:MAG: NUDIX hydrolase [Candidatus Eisenbacteria bacterium]|nr:NUDIX hydrolase [Candidatus Eisenbacteria bacterium]
MSADSRPEIQPIANLVITDPTGQVLLVRYGARDDDRYWLPGGDLEPYEHPEAAARRVTAELGLVAESLRLSHVDSFRGRRGWHLVFHYQISATGNVAPDLEPFWAAPEALPPTVHGKWEQDAVRTVLQPSAT